MLFLIYTSTKYLFLIAVSGPVLDLTKQHKLFLKLIAPMVFVTDIAFIFMGIYIYIRRTKISRLHY